MYSSLTKLLRSKTVNIKALSCIHNIRYMSSTLQTVDPILFSFIEHERFRQRSSLELIASENFTSPQVMEALGSCLTNKYAEGLPGKRYYGGNEYIDKIENLCIERALSAFKLEPTVWGANVQPYSGSVANLAIYNALLKPHDRIMGLDLPSGGHLTHGFYTAKRKVSVSSVYYESLPYQIKEDGYIDYDQLERDALLFKPKMIICGASAYPRDFDYSRFREVANKCGAYLMCDMAHTSGLIVAEQLTSPFLFCDVVMTTTHKTLRGPRAAIIFAKQELMDAINSSVFPALQGGPHENQIAAVATQLLEVQTPQFTEYAKQVITNAKVLADQLISHGYKLSTEGTDNHLVLVDLRPQKIFGSKVEKLCDMVNITINKNSVFGDKSALVPGGIRIGTAALTTRSVDEEGMITISSFIHHAIQLAIKIQNKSGKKLVDFINEASTTFSDEVEALKEGVREFALKLPLNN